MTQQEIDKLKKEGEKLQKTVDRIEELHIDGTITTEDYMYLISGTIG